MILSGYGHLIECQHRRLFYRYFPFPELYSDSGQAQRGFYHRCLILARERLGGCKPGGLISKLYKLLYMYTPEIKIYTPLHCLYEFEVIKLVITPQHLLLQIKCKTEVIILINLNIHLFFSSWINVFDRYNMSRSKVSYLSGMVISRTMFLESGDINKHTELP